MQNIIDAIADARPRRAENETECRCIRTRKEILPFRCELVDVRRLSDAATLRFVAHKSRAVKRGQMSPNSVAADCEALGQLDRR
jgi:hypothetical protein